MFVTRHRPAPEARERGISRRTTPIGAAALVLLGTLVATPAIATGVAATTSPGAARSNTTALLAPAAITTNSARLLASNCYQCHGTYGTGGFERLAGESATEIYSELKELAASTSSNNIMAAHAAGYTDAQLRAIAAYLSTAGK
jgi:cytochrome c553